MTKREFDGLRTEIMAQFSAMRQEIQAMLPRELYEVRHRQVVEDTQDLTQRLVTAEKAINELTNRLATAQLAATQQIASEVRPVEKTVADVRYETLNRITDLAVKTLFFVGGAIVTYLIYHH